eukprot:Rmarinus@m.13878
MQSALFERECGRSGFNRLSFSHHVHDAVQHDARILGNRTLIQRLRLQQKLEGHQGCVNAVAWNQAGDILLTGSDDRCVKLWSAPSFQLRQTVQTEHDGNIFCAKVVPFSNDRHLITAAADGHVRSTFLEPGGETKSKSLSHVVGLAFKIAFLPSCPFAFLATFQSGAVVLHDLRADDVTTWTVVNSDSSASAIEFRKSLDSQFFLGGGDPYLRGYDLRFTSSSTSANKDSTRLVMSFAPPDSLRKRGSYWRGIDMSCGASGLDISSRDEIVVTYKEDGVYLFDIADAVSSSDVKDACTKVRCSYEGRKNSQTFLKEVVFIGNESYVATGGDCGNLFIWEKSSGRLVNKLMSDSCILNGVAPHPHVPIIATCGIDKTVKIWGCGDSEIAEYVSKTFAKEAGGETSDRDPSGPSRLPLSMRIRSEDTIPVLTEEEAKDQMTRALTAREEGNESFKRGSFDAALRKYSDAIHHLRFHMPPTSADMARARTAELHKCLLNRAACALRLKDFDQAKASCSEVIDADPSNAKALYRRGQAYMEEKDFHVALVDLERAHTLQPGDKAVTSQLALCRARVKEAKSREKRAYSQMFK